MNSSGNTAVAVQGGAESGAVGAREAVHDLDLGEIIAAWPGLPEATRQAVLDLVRAAIGDNRLPVEPPR